MGSQTGLVVGQGVKCKVGGKSSTCKVEYSLCRDENLVGEWGHRLDPQ